MKTAIGKTEKVIASGDMELAQKGMIKAVSSIDRAVSKGVIHRNRGARLKSQLTRELNQAILKEKGG
jgi:small subunit ribosomal protein S20